MQWKKVAEICLFWNLLVICWKFYFLLSKRQWFLAVFLNHSANESAYSIKEANIILDTSENGSNLFLFSYFKLYIKYF